MSGAFNIAVAGPEMILAGAALFLLVWGAFQNRSSLNQRMTSSRLRAAAAT